MAGAAVATTVVVSIGPAVLSGTGDPAQATPSGSGGRLHGAAPAASPASPTGARSRPPFTGERRDDRSGGRHRAPGHADATPGEDLESPSGSPEPADEPSALPGPVTASGGSSTPDDDGAGGDGGAGGGLHVEVDDDGVVVDSDLTDPVEVPLPTPLPDLGL